MYYKISKIAVVFLIVYLIYFNGVGGTVFVSFLYLISLFFNNKFNNVVKKIQFIVSILFNLVTIIVVIMLIININIDFSNNSSLLNVYNSLSEKKNYDKFMTKLNKIPEIKNENIKNALIYNDYTNKELALVIKEYSTDKQEIFNFIEKEKFAFDGEVTIKKLIKKENWSYVNLIYLYQMELTEVEEEIQKGNIKLAKEKFKKELESIQKFQTNKLDSEGVQISFASIKIMIKFYLQNRKQLDMNNQMILWLKNIKEQTPKSYKTALLNEYNFYSYLVEHPEINLLKITDLSNQMVKKGQKNDENLLKMMKYPFYNKIATNKELKEYFIDFINKFSEIPYNENKYINSKTKEYNKPIFIINPIGKLTSFCLIYLTKEQRENLYFLKEKTLSLIEISEALILENKNYPKDRLSGENYIVEQNGNQIEVKSKLKGKNKEIILIKYE